MKFKTKAFILSLSFIVATGCVTLKKSDYSPEIYYNEEITDPRYYGSCRDGDIYIGKEKDIKLLIEKEVDGIFVVDERKDKDPNMKVINSYEITDPNTMRDIVTVLYDYDQKYPSKWSRTINSMVNEWRAHNIFYESGFYTDHAQDVDLNNDDEETFKKVDIKKLVKRKEQLK